MKYYILLIVLCIVSAQASDLPSRLSEIAATREKLETSIAERHALQASVCGCDDLCPMNNADVGECLNCCSSCLVGTITSYVLSEAPPLTKLSCILAGGSMGSQVGAMLKEWYLIASRPQSASMIESDDIMFTSHKKIQ